MEYEEQDENQDGGFFQRLKDSPRTVSALIIILIIAAAIYAFSGDTPNNTDDLALDDSIELTTLDDEEAAESEEDGDDTDDAMKEDTAMTSTSPSPKAATSPSPVAMEEIKKAVEGEKAPEKIDSGYVVTAQRGDGLTHLARRAAAQYLADNNAGYTVTNEHRVYIEDYIKDNMVRRPVRIGEQETISFDLIKAAVESAGGLSNSQLNNLTKYTPALR